MMIGRPLVSVILPTFNRAALLREAIESALAQTYRNLEVIVIDDGSVDETPRVLAELSARDPRVRTFRQDNAGVSAARNHALALSQGDYIAYLDSDDIWLPWKVELQLEVFGACPNVGMVWTDMDAIGPTGNIVHRKFLRRMYSAYDNFEEEPLFSQTKPVPNCWEAAPGELAEATVGMGSIYSQMFCGNLVHTPTVMLTRERAKQTGLFDESMRRGGEDFKYHLTTCRLGPVAFVDVASILYRTGGEDRITHPENQLFYARSYLRTIEDEFSQHRDAIKLTKPQVRRMFAEAHRWLADALLDAGERRLSRTHAWLAVRAECGSLTAWKLLLKSNLPESVLESMRRLKHRWQPHPTNTQPGNTIQERCSDSQQLASHSR